MSADTPEAAESCIACIVSDPEVVDYETEGGERTMMIIIGTVRVSEIIFIRYAKNS